MFSETATLLFVQAVISNDWCWLSVVLQVNIEIDGVEVGFVERKKVRAMPKEPLKSLSGVATRSFLAQSPFVR